MKKFCLIIIMLFMFVLTSCNSTKYANDYSAIDYVKAQNIVFGIRGATYEELEKYDMNNDNIITHIDSEIIRQMIDGYYDEYKITNKRKAIKYKEE